MGRTFRARCAGRLRGPDPALILLREECIDFSGVDRPAEPAKAREEDELELRHQGPGHADEQIVEATVLEVVLDAGAADPANPSVDHDELAMVDVSQRAEVPPCRAPAVDRP